MDWVLPHAPCPRIIVAKCDAVIHVPQSLIDPLALSHERLGTWCWIRNVLSEPPALLGNRAAFPPRAVRMKVTESALPQFLHVALVEIGVAKWGTGVELGIEGAEHATEWMISSRSDDGRVANEGQAFGRRVRTYPPPIAMATPMNAQKICPDMTLP